MSDGRLCDACGEERLVPFADLGDIPVLCGVHWEAHGDAVASPVGRMELAHCPRCAYVRNVAFDPDLLVYDTTMDTNLHFSPRSSGSPRTWCRASASATTWPASSCSTSAAARASSSRN